jgi:hypothetical protein
MKIKLLPLTFVAVMTLCASSYGATIFSQSFEPPLIQNWTLLKGSAGPVVVTDPQVAGSNFDGVDGSHFLLFGFGNNPGKIVFEIATVPGQEYQLSYTCAGTDTFTLPRRVQNITFTSDVEAFHGVITVIDEHTGLPTQIDDLEDLASESHMFTVPGINNWKIYQWQVAQYDFLATSDVTRIYFDTPLTTALASVGALDNVTVATVPEPSAWLLLTAAGLSLAVRRQTLRSLSWRQALLGVFYERRTYPRTEIRPRRSRNDGSS